LPEQGSIRIRLLERSPHRDRRKANTQVERNQKERVNDWRVVPAEAAPFVTARRWVASRNDEWVDLLWLACFLVAHQLW
jgi:hypothetical protein